MSRRLAAAGRSWGIAAGAIALFGVSFALLRVGWYRSTLTAHGDVTLYELFGQHMRAGLVPYRDFPVEYPPAALPVFLLPTLLPFGFTNAFAVEMFLCGAASIAAAALALRALGAGRRRGAATLGLLAAAPLALGPVFDTRFDLWPAALAVAAVAALLHERARTAGALLGLAFAAKLWPLVLAPVAVAYLWRRRGRNPALAAAGSFLAAAAACFAPFAAIAPAGVWHSVSAQVDRPLQIESLGAALLIAAHHLGGLSLTTVHTHGSDNLAGRLPDGVAAASSALQTAGVVALWFAFARLRRPEPRDAAVACAAAVAVLVAFGKVFSPQFLIWLVPLVPLAFARRGAVGSVLLMAALVLTQAWFPRHFLPLANGFAPVQSWLVLARDLVVVALAAVLALPRRRRHTRRAEIRVPTSRSR